MDNGVIAVMFFGPPTVVIVGLIIFALHSVGRLIVSAIQESRSRHARLERAYIAKHERQNAARDDARDRG